MPFLTHLENLYQDQIKGSIRMIEPAEVPHNQVLRTSRDDG